MKIPGGRGRARRAGALLIELLVVIVIIGILAALYFGARKGRGGAEQNKTTVGAAMDKAHSVECSSNLQQLRAAMQMKVSDEGTYPQSLDALGLGAIGKCPVSGKAYSYDPQTGKVWCTTPGHESL